MKKLMLLTLISALVLAVGCSPTGSGNGNASRSKGRDQLTLGLTVSRTGPLAAESSEQFNGLQLWADEVNKRGGIHEGNRNVQVKLVNYDDESSKTRVQQLYTRLVNDDRADFLVSPYSSGLTEAASVVAEQNRKLMMAVGAASDSIFQHGLTHVFQIYTPASRYLTGSIALLRWASPNASRVAIVHEEETFSTDVAKATRDYVSRQPGLELALFDGYPTGATDFGPFIARIAASRPDALLGGGHYQDGSTLVRQIEGRGIPLKLISILVAPSLPEFTQLGRAALGVVGPSQWEPGVTFSQEGARKQGLEWVGPEGNEVVNQYQQRFGKAPGYHAMGGYVSGFLLQHAIEKANGIGTQDVRVVLERLHAMTFWGIVQFSSQRGDYGRQIGHEMVQIQWQQTGDQLKREIVWPLEGRTAPFQPLQG